MLVKLAAIFFSMILVNNYVLVKFLGICPFLGVSKKLDSAVGMSCAVIFVMVLATLVTFPIQIFLLDANDLGYLQTIVFILIIAVLVQLIEIILKKYRDKIFDTGSLRKTIAALQRRGFGYDDIRAALRRIQEEELWEDGSRK